MKHLLVPWHFTTCIAFFFSFFFFIHSIFKYYYIPDTVLSTRDTKTNKKQSITLREFTGNEMNT